MDPAESVIVNGRNGLHGTVETSLLLGGSEPQVLVRLEDGQQVLIPSQALTPQADGTFFLGLDPAELPSGLQEAGSPATESSGEITWEQRTAFLPPPQASPPELRVTRLAHEREQVVEQSLLQEQAEVHRVPVQRLVDEPPPIRHEGDTVIIPLLEEVLVIQKRLMVREELHITRRQDRNRHMQRVVLRSEEAIITRVPHADDEGGRSLVLLPEA